MSKEELTRFIKDSAADSEESKANKSSLSRIDKKLDAIIKEWQEFSQILGVEITLDEVIRRKQEGEW